MSKFVPFESFYLLFFLVKNTKFREFWSFRPISKNIKIALKHFPTISWLSYMVCAVPNHRFLPDFMNNLPGFWRFSCVCLIFTAPVMQHFCHFCSFSLLRNGPLRGVRLFVWWLVYRMVKHNRKSAFLKYSHSLLEKKGGFGFKKCFCFATAEWRYTIKILKSCRSCD